MSQIAQTYPKNLFVEYVCLYLQQPPWNSSTTNATHFQKDEAQCLEYSHKGDHDHSLSDSHARFHQRFRHRLPSCKSFHRLLDLRTTLQRRTIGNMQIHRKDFLRADKCQRIKNKGYCANIRHADRTSKLCMLTCNKC